jgi:hypothetical protein
MLNLVSLSLGEKNKTINWSQNPEKTLRLWNGPERGRREKEWERRETETVEKTTLEQKGCCCRTRSSSRDLQLNTWKNNRNKALGH